MAIEQTRNLIDKARRFAGMSEKDLETVQVRRLLADMADALEEATEGAAVTAQHG